MQIRRSGATLSPMLYLFVTPNGGGQWQPRLPLTPLKMKVFDNLKALQSAPALAVQCTAWLDTVVKLKLVHKPRKLFLLDIALDIH